MRNMWRTQAHVGLVRRRGDRKFLEGREGAR